jgi:hypothetical protein
MLPPSVTMPLAVVSVRPETVLAELVMPELEPVTGEPSTSSVPLLVVMVEVPRIRFVETRTFQKLFVCAVTEPHSSPAIAL